MVAAVEKQPLVKVRLYMYRLLIYRYVDSHAAQLSLQCKTSIVWDGSLNTGFWCKVTLFVQLYGRYRSFLGISGKEKNKRKSLKSEELALHDIVKTN